MDGLAAAIDSALLAFARTVDVHMSAWVLTTPRGPLTFGAWIVEARLSGSPTGGDLDLRLPAARAAALGPGDIVSSIGTRPRA